jgi:rfaE bifunctional protein kinase chain/domain
MQAESWSLKAQGLRVEAERAGGRRLVFVSGNFNLVHPGHIRLLNFARSCGDELVVGLLADGEAGVAVPHTLRAEALRSMAAVGEVVTLMMAQVVPFIEALQPYAVVKGKEHETHHNPEREVVRQYGGHLIFCAGDVRFSIIDLIRRESEGAATPALDSAPDFLSKHGLEHSRLHSLVRAFGGVRALILGDLIVDEYIHCDPLGMSQEDPTIVVTPVKSQRFTGGAGIVAGHVAGLGGRAHFVSVTGNDATANAAADGLREIGVGCDLIRDDTRPTTLKQRFRAGGKTLLRVSHLRSHDAGEEYIGRVLDVVQGRLPETDVVIFSDFNYGCLPQSLVDSVSALCKEAGVPFVADSQASSQVGDVSRFKGAAMISATEREARLAVNDFKSSIQNVANVLLESSGAGYLVVKLGAEGLLVVTRGPAASTSSLPALNPNPVDVAGAGDALLVAASMGLSAGGSPWECAYLGSIAAGLQVARLGNVPLQQAALERELMG